MLPVHRKKEYNYSTVKNENTILPLYHLSNSNGKLKKHKYIKTWNIFILTVVIMIYMAFFFNYNKLL